MLVKTITVSMFATNCYLVGCAESNEAIIIDPGAAGKKIIDQVEALRFDVKYIVNTHGHVDHIGANRQLKAKYKVPIALSIKDLDLYANPGFFIGLVLRKRPEPDLFLAEGDSIFFGKHSLEIIETPGHTPGSICLKGESAVFCGDTLFSGAIGRTDLSGGSHSELMKSINEKIMVLPPDTTIYPGHGPVSTIQAEAMTNPFLTDR